MSRSRRWPAPLLLAAVLIAAGCGGSPEDTVLVSAAASLTDAFAAMERAYEELNPGVDVVLNLGGSSALREQILEGAPADVFASANVTTMEQVVDAGATSGVPQVFAQNEVTIAVPAGNPAGIGGLEDFADGTLLIGLCAAAVPCGDAGRRVLAAAGIEPAVDTNEPDVRALLTKLEVGELDAGIVYRTDVRPGVATVEGIEITEAALAPVDYVIAVLADAPNPTGAAGFVAFVTSPAGQRIMADFGFALP